MIISGGVNIYPQECENLLITHPKVADAAVFGVPHEDLGEEVKAPVEAMPGVPATPEFAQEPLAFCRPHRAHIKCPASLRRPIAATSSRQALQAPIAGSALEPAEEPACLRRSRLSGLTEDCPGVRLSGDGPTTPCAFR